MKTNRQKVASCAVLLALLLVPLLMVSGYTFTTAIPGEQLPPTLVWNVTWGTVATESEAHIAVDPAGYIYLHGWTHEPVPNPDVFLLKYDQNGTFLWNVTWGGAGTERPGDIDLDSEGNVYVTGATDSVAGEFDVYIMKFFPNKTLDWEESWGGPSAGDWGHDIVVNDSDSLYLTGYTRTYGAGGIRDVYVMKYALNGTHLWNDTWGVVDDVDLGRGIALGDDGNIYVTGYSVFPATGYDAFVSKYYPWGARDWTEYWSTAGNEYGRAIAVGPSTSIYMAAQKDAGDEGVVAKYDASGTMLWDEINGGAGWDSNYDITTDAAGNAYVISYSTTYHVGNGDACFFMYEPDGTLGWRKTWGGTAEEYGTSIAVNGTEDLYISGKTESYDVGGGDVFLARYKLNYETGRSPPPFIPGFVFLPVLGALLAAVACYLVWKKKVNRMG
jgi:hypothetical protein